MFPKQTAEGGRVRGPELDEKGVLPGHEVDFLDFGDFGEGLAGCGFVRAGGEADGDEGHQRPLEEFGVEPHFVAVDDPALLQLPNPLQHAGRGHAHLPGDLAVGNPRLLLKNLQDFVVDFVDHWGLLLL